MHIALIGTGCGRQTMTEEGKAAIMEADLIIGSARALSDLPANHAITAVLYKPEEIVSVLVSSQAARAAVVFCGDAGFHSGAGLLMPLLEKAGLEFEVLPGISSMQLLAARLHKPWQDWKLCSAHGVFCDIPAVMMEGKPVFFLTGGKYSPSEICRELTEAGLGFLCAVIGENLGYPEEQLTKGTAEELSKGQYAELSVLLAEAAPVYTKRVPGIPDSEFIRGEVPMTKQNIRASILSHLQLKTEDICWDIGAGTGSVSIEMALHARSVWAVECKEEGLELIRKNRQKFCAWNLRPVKALAPAGLQDLPVPDAVFIGGSRGNLSEILETAHQMNSKARLVVSAVTLETVGEAIHSLEKMDYQVEALQISVSESRLAGSLHLMTAQNPVFLISGFPV